MGQFVCGSARINCRVCHWVHAKRYTTNTTSIIVLINVACGLWCIFVDVFVVWCLCGNMHERFVSC